MKLWADKVLRVTEHTLGNGRYVLSEPPLGVGGMGTVWKAFDSVLHREVAVKELRIPDGLNPEEQDKLRLRALREARAAAGLDHPAIVTIHDVVDEGGRPWIVMRLLPGRTLDHVVRANGPLSPRRAAELGVRLVEALSAAHANGVLHRDVKPQNVMLGADDRWMLTDFGIASVAGVTRTLTGTGIVTGTLGYVAPERLSGAEPGAPADLWALGATLYYAVEGRHAYDFDDLPAMIAAVLTRDPEPMRLAGPLAPVIAGLMERDPTRRLTPAAAREQLLAIAGGYPTFENPTQPITDRTEKIPTGTKRYGDGTKVLDPAGPEQAGHDRGLRALTVVLAALNGAFGAFLALLVYSVIDGMPLWILVALAVAGAAGAGLGAPLAARVARKTSPSAALVGSAVLTGEAVTGGGLLVDPRLPIATLVLFGVALVSLTVWLRLSKSTRQRLVPAERLAHVTTIHRTGGVCGLLLGAALAGTFLWLAATERVRPPGGNYVAAVLIAAGVLVVATSLLTLPAVRSLPQSGVRRRLPVTTVSAALVIPTLVAVVAGVQYVGRLDDFTSTPDICSFDVLSPERIEQVMDSSPEPENDSFDDYVDCDWKRETDSDGKDAAELKVELLRYDDTRGAERAMGRDRDTARDLGKSVTDLSLGDDSFRRPYDGTIGSEDTLGLSVEVRVENLILELDLDQSESRGAPSASTLEALAADLTRELESRQPQR